MRQRARGATRLSTSRRWRGRSTTTASPGTGARTSSTATSAATQSPAAPGTTSSAVAAEGETLRPAAPVTTTASARNAHRVARQGGSRRAAGRAPRSFAARASSSFAQALRHVGADASGAGYRAVRPVCDQRRPYSTTIRPPSIDPKTRDPDEHGWWASGALPVGCGTPAVVGVQNPSLGTRATRG